MQWQITVKPTTSDMIGWVWLGQSANREDYLSGVADTHEAALAEAKAQVDEAAARRRAIREATTVEDYTPAGEEPPTEEAPVQESAPLIVHEGVPY
jgi:hypothetical protein